MRRHHDYDLSKGSEVMVRMLLFIHKMQMRQLKALQLLHKMDYWCKRRTLMLKRLKTTLTLKNITRKKRSGLATSFKRWRGKKLVMRKASLI